MRKTWKSLIIACSISSLCLVGHTSSGAANNEIAGRQASDGNEMLIHVDEEGSQFRITNIGQTAIDSLTLTTYPPPLATNILLLQYSFSSAIGTLEKGATVAVKKDELKNVRGASLSDSKRRAGAIRMGGKVRGQLRGLMFTRSNGRWVLAPPGVKWGATSEGELLGPIDEPRRENLNIGLHASEGAPIYIIENDEALAIQELVVTAFPLPKSGTVLNENVAYTIKLGTLEKRGTVVVQHSEMRNRKGEALSYRQTTLLDAPRSAYCIIPPSPGGDIKCVQSGRVTSVSC